MTFRYRYGILGPRWYVFPVLFAALVAVMVMAR